MSCKRIRNLLPLYDDVELEIREREAVRSHLLQCRACQEELERIRRARQGVASLRLVDVPPDGVRKTLEALGNGQRLLNLAARRWLQRPLALGGLATGLIALVVVLLVPGLRGLQEPAPPPLMPMATMAVEDIQPFALMEKATLRSFAPSGPSAEVVSLDPASFLRDLDERLTGAGHPDRTLLIEEAERRIVVQVNSVPTGTLETILDELAAKSPNIVSYRWEPAPTVPEQETDVATPVQVTISVLLAEEQK